MEKERKEILEKIYKELEGIKSVYDLFRIHHIIEYIKKDAPTGTPQGKK